MAGLVPAIHVFVAVKKEDVDARHKAGHDDGDVGLSPASLRPLPCRPKITSLAAPGGPCSGARRPDLRRAGRQRRPPPRTAPSPMRRRLWKNPTARGDARTP